MHKDTLKLIKLTDKVRQQTAEHNERTVEDFLLMNFIFREILHELIGEEKTEVLIKMKRNQLNKGNLQLVR
jgi:hypothetical protein